MSLKLTPAQVAALRRRYAQGGITLRTLAAEFYIHEGHASRIVNRKVHTDIAALPVPAALQRIADGLS